MPAAFPNLYHNEPDQGVCKSLTKMRITLVNQIKTISCLSGSIGREPVDNVNQNSQRRGNRGQSHFDRLYRRRSGALCTRPGHPVPEIVSQCDRAQCVALVACSSEIAILAQPITCSATLTIGCRKADGAALNLGFPPKLAATAFDPK